MISPLSFFLKEGMTSVLNSLVSKHIYVPKSINEHHIENQSLSATKSDMEAIFDTEFFLFPRTWTSVGGQGFWWKLIWRAFASAFFYEPYFWRWLCPLFSVIEFNQQPTNYLLALKSRESLSTDQVVLNNFIFFENDF